MYSTTIHRQVDIPLFNVRPRLAFKPIWLSLFSLPAHIISAALLLLPVVLSAVLTTAFPTSERSTRFFTIDALIPHSPAFQVSLPVWRLLKRRLSQRAPQLSLLL